MTKKYVFIFSILFFLAVLAGCNDKKQIIDTDINQQTSGPKTEQSVDKPNPPEQDEESQTKEQVKTPASNQDQASQTPTPPNKNADTIEVVAQPESIPVLVNKHNKLPDDYSPKDLVTAKIPFISSATSEKRMLRSEAAEAIANLFAGAETQGVSLLGVSGYRSHATQVGLFNYYVNKDGYEKARTYSALPGTSEHETGLAIDVTGGNGKCPAQDCFAGTPEANWLQAHVADYGFVIRYPYGKDTITGYKYEPWHLRYVGKAIAKEIMGRGITMEEYYNAVPVNN